jgi:N-acetylneuraminic acid mutarotase
MTSSPVLPPAHAPFAGLRSLRTSWLGALLLGVAALLSGCGGGSGGGSYFGVVVPPGPQAPAGLSYAMTSAIYEVGRAIVPNRPSASGGAVERYAIAPPLPAGLVLDPATGVISGTPGEVAPPTVYVVTAENAGGNTTARVEIEVRNTPAAPAGLSYRVATAVYTVGETIAPNTPSSSGGPIQHYAIAPALPAGLLFDAASGVISGTPTAPAAEADYTVTGTNVSGSAVTTLRLAVHPALVAPASLAYATPEALYVTGEPIVPNTAQVTGGAASEFSVSPALPTGLSLNTETGAITGTPSTVQRQATYTVTARNSAGSAQTQVLIIVTGRGSWAPTQPLPTALRYLAMVALRDGRVLAAGGMTNAGVSAAADIYDPATGVWSAAAPMLHARSDPSATLLPDGRVLVVGGVASDNTTLATAELYDPAANTWTATGGMFEARTRHTATLLPSGKLLVIGGYSQNGSLGFSQTAELYDPATGTWALMATPMSTPRGQHAAQLLPGGNTLLVVGGVNRTGFVTTAELFPVIDSGSSSLLPDPVVAGNVHTSVLLQDGSVLVMSDGSETAMRFHPGTSSWTTSTFSGRRALPTMTLLADGRVLLAGGAGSGGVRQTTAEIYNPDANVWTAAASMSTGRSAAAAVLLSDGSVLAAGGFDSGGSSLDAAERYTP